MSIQQNHAGHLPPLTPARLEPLLGGLIEEATASSRLPSNSMNTLQSLSLRSIPADLRLGGCRSNDLQANGPLWLSQWFVRAFALIVCVPTVSVRSSPQEEKIRTLESRDAFQGLVTLRRMYRLPPMAGVLSRTFRVVESFVMTVVLPAPLAQRSRELETSTT